MAASQMIRILCVKNNISVAELARKNGTTPQNFNKKLQRESFGTDELYEIAHSLGCDYKSAFILPDGDIIEEKFINHHKERKPSTAVKNTRPLTGEDLERRCRYRLSRHGLRMRKAKGNTGYVYYIYEAGGDDAAPDELEDYRWLNLDQLLAYCGELEEKEVTEREGT